MTRVKVSLHVEVFLAYEIALPSFSVRTRGMVREYLRIVESVLRCSSEHYSLIHERLCSAEPP